MWVCQRHRTGCVYGQLEMLIQEFAHRTVGAVELQLHRVSLQTAGTIPHTRLEAELFLGEPWVWVWFFLPFPCFLSPFSFSGSFSLSFWDRFFPSSLCWTLIPNRPAWVSRVLALQACFPLTALSPSLFFLSPFFCLPFPGFLPTLILGLASRQILGLYS